MSRSKDSTGAPPADARGNFGNRAGVASVRHAAGPHSILRVGLTPAEIEALGL